MTVKKRGVKSILGEAAMLGVCIISVSYTHLTLPTIA